MKHAREYLAAGALLPPGLRIKSDIPADPVSARIYNHPALGDAPVVRLTPDKLAKGDDLEMEFLGFSRAAVKKRVAKRKRQALGFPGWALINDPKHAKYALKVVKRLKKAARKAKSKPGRAQEMFLEIAEELGRGVPAFLPSYWEEVGRIFIRLGNTAYGARAFGKAREAEKMHALTPSLEDQGAAFVEFALCGALTIKSLIQYGRDLQGGVPPRAAWEQFRDICIRRTLGGVPPWAAMAKDLRGRMKAAGVDLKREEKTFLKAVIESPAIARAPESFWRDYSKTIADLISDDPGLGRRLLDLFPEIKDQCFVMTWIDHLDEWGLLENLGREKRGPKDGIAPWFNTLFKQWGESREKTAASPLLFELLETCAGQIKKDRRPLVLTPGRWRKKVVDINVLERCLQL
ncbi:MAG: hypothetical protein GY859_34730, partial [Desulfobacterales bacterium]|nr:hypothetical protein [Desulfobacterales bacterium]